MPGFFLILSHQPPQNPKICPNQAKNPINTCNIRYPINIILSAISTYNLGNSFAKTSKIINKNFNRFNISVTPKTIQLWYNNYKQNISYSKIRNKCKRLYKPEAEKINPIEQFTIYALSLASRTKLDLYSFKCAWFDEFNYYEFYPLHTVYINNKDKI